MRRTLWLTLLAICVASSEAGAWARKIDVTPYQRYTVSVSGGVSMVAGDAAEGVFVFFDDGYDTRWAVVKSGQSISFTQSNWPYFYAGIPYHDPTGVSQMTGQFTLTVSSSGGTNGTYSVDRSHVFIVTGNPTHNLRKIDVTPYQRYTASVSGSIALNSQGDQAEGVLIFYDDGYNTKWSVVKPGQSISFTQSNWAYFYAGIPYDCPEGVPGMTGAFTLTLSSSGGTNGTYSVDKSHVALIKEGNCSTTSVPDASFTWSPTSPTTGQAVQFTDTSTNSPTTWSWSFGDGSTSTSRNPSHSYSSAGTKNVTLTASNASGADSVTHAVTVGSASCAANRSLPDGYTPGQPVAVAISVSPAAGTLTYAVEDAPPNGWTVSGIDNSGTWDSGNRKVKWGPFFDATTRTLRYSATPPTGTTGTETFSGTVSVDGMGQAICGDSSIDPGSYHPADTGANYRIELNEVTAYGAAWKTGATWPTGPSPIPINYVTNAGLIWKSGELYHYDGSTDPPFVPGSSKAVSEYAAAVLGGTAVSAFTPTNYTPGVGVQVRIATTPESSTQVYALEDAPPAGWAVSGITDSGSWDAVNGKVKWGPYFDSTARNLTYVATPPAGETGTRAFAGTASFDGAGVQVTGARSIGSGGAVSGTAFYLLGVAHNPGYNNTNWRTDVEVCNPGIEQAGYTFAFLRRDEANLSPSIRSYTLSGSRCTRYGDIVEDGFGLSNNAGALRLEVTRGDVLATKRTYNDAAAGTYGSFSVFLDEDAAIENGEVGMLMHLSESQNDFSGFRTNIEMLNITPSTIQVSVELYSSAGVMLGTIPVSLEPLESMALNKIFRRVTTSVVDDGYVLLRTSSTGGMLLASAGVVDNQSGDGVSVPTFVLGS